MAVKRPTGHLSQALQGSQLLLSRRCGEADRQRQGFHCAAAAKAAGWVWLECQGRRTPLLGEFRYFEAHNDKVASVQPLCLWMLCSKPPAAMGRQCAAPSFAGWQPHCFPCRLRHPFVAATAGQGCLWLQDQFAEGWCMVGRMCTFPSQCCSKLLFMPDWGPSRC